MKVYVDYEVPEFQTEIISGIAGKAVENLLQLHKYKIMWKLRSLEKEMDAEGGMVILRSEGKIELKNFSRELGAKIFALLQGPD